MDDKAAERIYKAIERVERRHEATEKRDIEDHRQIENRMGRLTESINSLTKLIETDHRWTADQEKRIRGLEGSRNFQSGVGAILVLAWGWVARHLHINSG